MRNSGNQREELARAEAQWLTVPDWEIPKQKISWEKNLYSFMAKPKSQFSLARDFIDNEDNRTVYSKCAFWLLPWEAKPGVRLMHDWIYLLTV